MSHGLYLLRSVCSSRSSVNESDRARQAMIISKAIRMLHTDIIDMLFIHCNRSPANSDWPNSSLLSTNKRVVQNAGQIEEQNKGEQSIPPYKGATLIIMLILRATLVFFSCLPWNYTASRKALNMSTYVHSPLTFSAFYSSSSREMHEAML
jgi:hypothetical protein